MKYFWILLGGAAVVGVWIVLAYRRVAVTGSSTGCSCEHCAERQAKGEGRKEQS